MFVKNDYKSLIEHKSYYGNKRTQRARKTTKKD
jgi:hypothetical protein